VQSYTQFSKQQKNLPKKSAKNFFKLPHRRAREILAKKLDSQNFCAYLCL
jgi:hypothetical protein